MMKTLLLAVTLAVATASAWKVDLWPLHSQPELSTMPPQLAGDTVLFYPYQPGPLYAVNITSKKLMWGYSFDDLGGFVGVPAANVALVSDSDFTFAYDLTSGEMLWANDTFGSINTDNTFLVAGSTVVFATTTAVMGFDARSGNLLYTAFENSNSYDNSYSLGYISSTLGGFSNASAFIAFDIVTGKIRWSVSLSTDGYYESNGMVTVGEDIVVLANYSSATGTAIPSQREAVLLNATTGKPIRTLLAMENLRTYAQYAKISNGKFYAFVNDNDLECFDIATGMMLWSVQLNGNYLGGLQYNGDALVLVGNQNGQTSVSIYNSQNFSLVRTISNIPTTAYATTYLFGDTLLVLNLQGFVAINVQTGEVALRNENSPDASSFLYANGEYLWSSAGALNGESTTPTKKH